MYPIKMLPMTLSFSRCTVFQPTRAQRLVHRQEFKMPYSASAVEELSVDGGKVRQSTPQGEQSIWRDYKAARLHGQGTEAFFQDNQTLRTLGE